MIRWLPSFRTSGPAGRGATSTKSHRVICAMACEIDHPVTMIVNLSAAPNPPDGALLPHLQYFWNMKPANLDPFIVVGPSRFMQMMGQIFARIVMGDVVAFVETMGEVEPILARAQMAQPHS